MRAAFPIMILVLCATCEKAPPGNVPANNQPTSFTYRTIEGASVVSPVEVPMTALNAIDMGIQAGIDKMPPAWQNARKVSDYTVRFVNPETHNQDGSPALLVNGTIQAAGQTIGYCYRDPKNCAGTFYKCGQVYLRLPHQAESNWGYLDYLEGTAHAESEHEQEGENSATEFCKWAYPNEDIHFHRP
jgi:hypothetical protein